MSLPECPHGNGTALEYACHLCLTAYVDAVVKDERTAIAKLIDKMHADCPDKEARLWLWAAARAVEERTK